jgi:hypothetical protein
MRENKKTTILEKKFEKKRDRHTLKLKDLGVDRGRHREKGGKS